MAMSSSDIDEEQFFESMRRFEEALAVWAKELKTGLDAINMLIDLLSRLYAEHGEIQGDGNESDARAT